MREVDFARLGFQERRDIQEWVAANPGILDEDLLIIAKEFSGFDRTNERLDLLAVDQDGKLVVIELKRDDSGADMHWQAIKYASYLRHASVEHIVGIFASYQDVLEGEAANKLEQHLDAEDLNALNDDQRIMLVSHRFAREVTSAALWLNEQALGDNLITCIQLTPYQDEQTGSLYVQANTIIPVPGAEDYVIGVGEYTRREAGQRRGWNNDEVTHFLKRVGRIIKSGLVGQIKPDRTSRVARAYKSDRYYRLWYSRKPWSRDVGGTNFTIWFTEGNESWKSILSVSYESNQELNENDVSVEDWIGSVERALEWPREVIHRGRVNVDLGVGELNDDFGNQIAERARCIIEVITPIVDEFWEKHGGGDGAA